MTDRIVHTGDDFLLPEVMRRHRTPPTTPGLFTLRDDTLILQDPAGTHTGDGTKFFTAARVGGALGEWYGYVSGHDSQSIWLITADDVKGPWTWRQSVVTAGDVHVASPHIEYVGGVFRLYLHEDMDTTDQPTFLRTSADGVTFGAATKVLNAPGGDGDWSQHNSASTSYFRPLRYPGGWVGVYQANNFLKNAQTGLTVTTSVGWATSEDGLTWYLEPRPLFGNRPGQRGPFSGCLFRIHGDWYYMALNHTAGVVEVYRAETLQPGAFALVQTITVPGGASYVDFPQVYWDGEIAHLWYGATTTPASPANAVIRHAYLEWSA